MAGIDLQGVFFGSQNAGMFGCGGSSTVSAQKDAVGQDGGGSEAHGDGTSLPDIYEVPDGYGSLYDKDNDGYIDIAYKGQYCIENKPGIEISKKLCDCNDNIASINPGAQESCNEIDDNCNGITDEGCIVPEDVKGEEVPSPDVIVPNDAEIVDACDLQDMSFPPEVKEAEVCDDQDGSEALISPEVNEVSKPEVIVVEGCGIENSGVLAEAEGIQFCNLPTIHSTNIPILPVCIKPGEGYEDKTLDQAIPPRIMLDGAELPLDDVDNECNPTETGIWAGAKLNPGKNYITGEITYTGGEKKNVGICVTYDPNYSTAGQNLLYGISNEQIVVINADQGWMMGKIYSPLPGFGPKNLVLFTDYSEVFSPREAGIDVIDTASNQIVKTVVKETGGYASLTEDGSKLFVNRHTKDTESGSYYVNVFDSVTWENILSFPAKYSELGPIISKSGKLYTAYDYKSMSVYYPPEYATSKDIDASGYLCVSASSPTEDIIIAGCDCWVQTINIINTKEDKLLYNLDGFPTFGDMSDAVFSPNGKEFYFVGHDELVAHSVEFQATLWTAPLSEWDWNHEIAKNPYGLDLFVVSHESCANNLTVYDADKGGKLKVFPNIPFNGDMVYKPAY